MQWRSFTALMALALLRASPATAQPTPDLSGDAGDWWWIVLIVLLLGTQSGSLGGGEGAFEPDCFSIEAPAIARA